MSKAQGHSHKAMRQVTGVTYVHDRHILALSSGKTSLTD